jgi:glycosyltransferase involved in cell wall biosynthesis
LTQLSAVKSHCPPLVSVIMPVYNNYAYLRESIQSILNQTFEDFEFIILDDCSTEPIREVIGAFADPRIVLVRNERNIGCTRSLNRCLDIARGRYIARQDGDDVSLPTRLQKQIARFSATVGLVSCWGYSITAQGERVPEQQDYYLMKQIRISDQDIRRKITEANYILGPGSVFTREVFQRIGYYDESLYFAQDYNYWIRILQHHDVQIVHEELYLRRNHDRSSRKLRPHLRAADWNQLCNERAREFPVISRSDCASLKSGEDAQASW